MHNWLSLLLHWHSRVALWHCTGLQQGGTKLLKITLKLHWYCTKLHSISLACAHGLNGSFIAIPILYWQHCIEGIATLKNCNAVQLNFKLQHFPVRQVAGPDRSGNFPDRIDLKHNLSRSDGQTSCLLSDRP